MYNCCVADVGCAVFQTLHSLHSYNVYKKPSTLARAGSACVDYNSIVSLLAG